MIIIINRQLSKEGQKFGYYVNRSKSWLIVKSGELAEEAKRVFGEEVNITTEGQRHVGAVIASQEYKYQYCEEKVCAWKEEMVGLSEIAKSQPRAAYIAFTKGYKSKFTYFMRAIGSFKVYVVPIHEVIEDLLLPVLFGQSEPLPNEVRRLTTLATGQGGLGIPDLRSAVTSSEARLDIKAGGFWARGVTAFFDVRVTHVNSKCYQSKPTSEVSKEQEEEKKRKYQQRVLDVEMGSFTPLVFGTNGGMGNECQRFLKHLADKIAQKDTEPYHVVITWLRTQISFELLRSVHACARGSRMPFRNKIEQSLDCKINVASADI